MATAIEHTLAAKGSPGVVRILGIDPGLNTTGYGVIEVARGGPKLLEAGIVRGRTKNSLTTRVAEIHEGLTEVFRHFSPSVVALEQLYSHYQRPRTAILMGHARGVICLAAAQAGATVVHYAATRVKKVITGSGRASKEQVQKVIQQEWNLPKPPEPNDVSDALALALCHYYLQPAWAALSRK